MDRVSSGSGKWPRQKKIFNPLESFYRQIAHWNRIFTFLSYNPLLNVGMTSNDDRCLTSASVTDLLVNAGKALRQWWSGVVQCGVAVSSCDDDVVTQS